MLKKLLGRHRVTRIGATIVGASVLAVGFASPAFAAQSVNNGNGGNTNADNYLIVQGGSNTTYLLMQQEADLFNTAPGCNLVGSGSPGAQPLDYGCPGYNDTEGTAASAETTAQFTATFTAGVKKITLTPVSPATLAELAPGQFATDSAHAISEADPFNTANTTTGRVKLRFATSAAATSDTITVTVGQQQGENGYAQWGQDNPFNDVAVEEPSYGSGNGIGELEGTGGSHSANLVNPDTETAVTGVNVSPIDSARSSAAPSLAAYASGGNYQGLNFVAYGMDAVSYLTWNKFDGVATDASKCLATIERRRTSARRRS